MAMTWGKRAALGVAILFIFFGAFGAGFFKGHSLGFKAAEHEGRALLAEFRETITARQNEALQETNARLRQEAAKALKAGADYAHEKERHENTRRILEKKLTGLADGGAVRVAPEIVRLLNEAVGAACADGTGKNSDTATTHGAPRPRAPACAEIRTGDVTNRDLAAFLLYYGERSRTMEAQLNALITRIEEYNE